MNALRSLPAIVTLVCCSAVYAQSDATDTANGHKPEFGRGWRDGGRFGGGFERIVFKLDLSAGQKAQIKAIHAQTQPQFESLQATARTTRAQIEVTSPYDPNYAALIATLKANSAALIQLQSDTFTQIYAVLTRAQQAQLPSLAAQ